jgi:hypothetical protein
MSESPHPPHTSALAQVYYPPPPWVLYGSGLVASFRVRASAVAGLVPAPLSLVRLPGDLALGYLAAWRYGSGSTLEYSELLSGVLARHRFTVAPFVTHIGVDTRVAQRAGREHWHLPKQHWSFEWYFDASETSLRVWDGPALVCMLGGVPVNTRMLPLQTSVTFLNMHDHRPATITGQFDIKLAAVTMQVQVGPDGPLAPLLPRGRLLSVALKGQATVPAPTIIETT